MEHPPITHHKKKVADPFYITIFVLAIVLAIIAGFYFGRMSLDNPEQIISPGEDVICTLEAKICPDGSTVGRQGPNCEFAKCPGE